MACFWKHINDIDIQITRVKELENINFYLIRVRIDTVAWTVPHRYSDFYDLHQILCSDHGVSKALLPPKRTRRNKCPTFIETRRQALEVYLHDVLNYLKLTMPRVFIEFLEFHVYDTFYLLKNLAFSFYNNADTILGSGKAYKFNPVELYAISVCFKEPFPNIVDTDNRYDLSHVLDLCSQLVSLTIEGKPHRYMLSTIEPNKLKIDLSFFKSLQTLIVQEMPLENVINLGNLRTTLKSLKLTKTNTTNLSQIIQCDILHKSQVEANQAWTGVTNLNLSGNNLMEIDRTINLVPNLKVLNLNNNIISKIEDLSDLPQLTHLYLSNNLIVDCEDLHTKLGNVLVLDLSQNNIASLKGFAKLYSLETLNLSCNNIGDITEISHIGSLPCLENIMLTGNVLATIVDYRAKIFEWFGTRAKDICLDNEKPSQSELDKAAVLQALTFLREGKTPQF